MTDLKRRDFLAGAAGLAASAAIARRAEAQTRSLSVFAPPVIERVSTKGPGGSIIEPWTAETGLGIEWTTFTPAPLFDRILRETSLNTTSVDVGFILNAWASPQTAALFEPLDEWLERDPIEDFDDVFPGLRAGMTINGSLIGIPFRHATSGLHYNAAILEANGFSGPPSTMEELEKMALACTGKRDDGAPVVGLVLPGLKYPNVVDFARAWNGEFVTADFACGAAEPPMVNAASMLRRLYEAGALPRNIATMGQPDADLMMQSGRAVFTVGSMGRNQIYNSADQSQVPGQIQTVAIPASKTIQSEYQVAPAKVEFWGAAIPRQSTRKEASWSFIRNLLLKNHTLIAALNGNGPVRASTYTSQEFRKRIPYAEEEQQALSVARVPLPAFDESARAGDIFLEEMEAAVLGFRDVEEAMVAICSRVDPLLP